MGDVGRQGQSAVAFGQVPQAATVNQFQREKFARGAGAAGYHDGEGIGQAQPRARLGRLAGAHLGDGVPFVNDALEQHLDPAAAVLDAEEARLDHARVVEDEQIPGAHQGGQVGETAVGELPAGDVQQPAAAALGGGVLGDQLGREGKVEIVDGQRHGVTKRNGLPLGKRNKNRKFSNLRGADYSTSGPLSPCRAPPPGGRRCGRMPARRRPCQNHAGMPDRAPP